MPTAQARPVPSLDLSSPEVHIAPKSACRPPRWESAAPNLGFASNALVDGAYVGDYYPGWQEDRSDHHRRAADTPNSTQDIEALPDRHADRPAGARSGAGRRGASAAAPNRSIIANGCGRSRSKSRRPADVPLGGRACGESSSEIVAAAAGKRPARQAAIASRCPGTADKLRDTWQALRFNVILALLITYLLMAALFESWLYPLVIIFSVPLGAVGGVLGLQLLNLFVLAAARRAHHARLRDSDRHRGQQSDPDRAPVAQSHARGRHVAPSEAILESVAHANSTDLHDHHDDRPGTVAAGAVSRSRQRTVSRPGQRRAGRTGVSTVFTLVLVPTLV